LVLWIHSLSLKLPKKRSSSSTNILSNKVFEAEDKGDEDEYNRDNLYFSTNQSLLKQTTQEPCDDPTALAYDEVYEQLHSNERFEKQSERKSRYLASLKARAEERKMEQELLEERLSFREREEEEKRGEFKDKEKFVTSAYKEKLKKLKEWEQRQLQEETTQQGKRQPSFSKFYSNLLTNDIDLGSKETEAPESESKRSSNETSEPTEKPRKQTSQEENAELEQQRRKALFGEPEKRPGGLFIPSVKNSDAKETENRSTATKVQAKGTASRERKDEDSVNKARERYLARKRQRLESGSET
jgi:coiled-coil domain-containing protein 55